MEQTDGVLVRAFLDEGAVRMLLVEARGPAEYTRQVHGLGKDAARLGAQAVVAAGLNSAWVKGDEQLTLQLQGARPRCAVYADVTADGHLRARVTPADLRLSAGRIVGILVAVKSLGSRELYRGITEVSDTTLEGALAQHIEQSTQVDDVLRIGVTQDDDGSILQAGGFLVERLPEDKDHPSLSSAAFEERYAWLRDADIQQVLTQLAFGSLGDRPLHVLEHRPITWQCRCSRERVTTTLRSLGADTLGQMATEDRGAEVSCDFCHTVHRFDEAELRSLFDEGK